MAKTLTSSQPEAAVEDEIAPMEVEVLCSQLWPDSRRLTQMEMCFSNLNGFQRDRTNYTFKSAPVQTCLMELQMFRKHTGITFPVLFVT